MSQIYVHDGALSFCASGAKPSAIQVSSQSTIKLKNGKLAATELDRFKGNFVCFKMSMAGALLGAAVGAAIAATGGAALAGVAATAMTGSTVGGIVGGLVSRIPSICSLLCKPAPWSVLHPTAKIEGLKVLMDKATVKCLLGGSVSITIPHLPTVLDMAHLAGTDIYRDDHQDTVRGYKPLSEDELNDLGLTKSDFDDSIPRSEDHKDSGFYARLYKNEKTGKYALVYRGSEMELNDWKQNFTQGVGLNSTQHNRAVELARKVKNSLSGQDVTIAGHSLGGGLATAGAAATGYPTYTFNAAGVHTATFLRNSLHRSDTTHIQAYYSNQDPLNKLQDNKGLLLGGLSLLGGAGKVLSKVLKFTGALPQASGQRHKVETDADGIIDGHSVGPIIEQLEKQLTESGGSTGPVFGKR